MITSHQNEYAMTVKTVSTLQNYRCTKIRKEKGKKKKSKVTVRSDIFSILLKKAERESNRV